MTVETNGPIRGFLARWVMRLEAAGGLLRMAFLGVTAASTLTSALALIGFEDLAPYMLLLGILATFVFAYGYVETGIYNRKNRESVDRGDNYAGPTMRIDDELMARAFKAALENRELTDQERNAIRTELDYAFDEYRNGIEVDQ